MVFILNPVCVVASVSSRSNYFKKDPRRIVPAEQCFYSRSETLRVLAISRGVAKANVGQRTKALIDHHDMPIEVGRPGEDVTFALRILLR